jgi:Zn-dependent M28 family amino/carboxypeptidase
VRKQTAAAAMVAAAIALVPATAEAKKGNARDGSPRDPRAQQFVREVSVDRIERHQQRLQQIADANGGTRVVTGPGYTASVDYVVRRLERAGYTPKVTPFNFPIWEETQPAVLEQVTPTAKTYRYGTAEDDGSPDVDFITLSYSPTATLSGAKVIPTNDVEIPASGPGTSTSGCEPEDYPASVRGNVVLIQRGTCAFVDKAAAAQEAGAAGAIIFNDGAGPGRQAPVFVADKVDLDIPVVVSSFAVGKELYDAYEADQNPTVNLSTFGHLRDRFFDQVLAETKKGSKDHVVVVGAHLDSVEAGPGINDDGSGTSTLLTMAERLARPGHPLEQKIRFAWWGGEEEGLIGSSYYASHLTDAQADKVDVMLDYDMLSSPNYVRFVYDGDGSDGEDNPAGPAGSGTVEEVFREWFAAKRQPVEATPFDGRSDYVGFTERGIPAGGVFAGAEGVKTPREERIYGGSAGSWYDPCYHQACDDITTVLTGVPPLEAEGLASEDEDATDADKATAAQKMRGGSRRSCQDLCSAAAYATWYFASVKNPFGTGARTASIATKHSVRRHGRPKAGKVRFQGHHRLGR